MPPKSKSQGESKQGLIITLVFFILATIGLGVATYYGFAGQEALEKAAKEEVNKAKVFQDDRNWYKFQAKMFRSYLGQAETLEGVETLGTEKEQFDRGTMKGGKDKDDVTKVLKALEEKYHWEGNKAKETAESVINALNAKRETLANRNLQLEKEISNAKKELAKRDDELLAARKDFDKNLKDLEAKYTAEFTKSDANRLQLIKDFDAYKVARVKDQTDAEAKQNQLNAEINKLKKDIAFLNKSVKEKEATIAAFETKAQRAPASMRTDWRIVRMDARGTNPYINLGSADHVKPQLTFSIHGVSADGRPNPEPKGTLEVVNVVGPHLSQTRITSIKDRNRDPVLERDVLYNPSWDPNIKKHVAIAGIVDLTGDGRDSLFEFMRNLERQNIVVDAYVDPKDGSPKGQVTFRTDFLIMGTVPDRGGAGEKAILNGQNRLESEAKKYGVPKMGLYQYLDTIGYRLPHSARNEKPSLYDPNLRPEQAPRLGGDNAPPPMKPDK
jgi:hypothetical protein